jgi:hypothetical protein
MLLEQPSLQSLIGSEPQLINKSLGFNVNEDNFGAHSPNIWQIFSPHTRQLSSIVDRDT